MSIIDRHNSFIYFKSHKTASRTTEIHLITNSKFGNDIYYTSREIKELGYPRAKRNRTILSGQSRIWFDFPKQVSYLNKIRGTHRLFPPLLQHDSCERIKYLFGSSFFNNAFKVTSVRNPWDALVSYYLWEKSGQQGRVSEVELKWEHWLEKRLNPDSVNRLSAAQEFLFYPYLFLNNVLVIDNFIFFEDLAGSMDQIGKKLGLKIDSLKLLHFKKSKRDKDYRPFFTDIQAEKVAKHFSKYLEVLNYSFNDVGKTPENAR
jgi:hypothetical protein